MNQLSPLSRSDFLNQQKISLPVPENFSDLNSSIFNYQSSGMSRLNTEVDLNNLRIASSPYNGNCSPFSSHSSQMIVGSANEPSLFIVANPIIFEAVNYGSCSDHADQYCMWDLQNQLWHNIPPYPSRGWQWSPVPSENKLHFENLEQVKQVIGTFNPNMTKDEMYDEMLKHYQYQKYVEIDEVTHKEKVTYICKYNEWNKVFTKTWNLLDHVRMHEGIRPFQCKHCPKSFTQKGNLKKHQIQHTIATLKERKRFKCHICNKGYTEKYNLEVRDCDLSLDYNLPSFYRLMHALRKFILFQFKKRNLQ